MTDHTATTPLTPLERVFKRLAATYGAAWDRALGQAPLMDVMTVWSHELDGLMQSRNSMLAIAWALDNLPERCPNVIEFKHLCRAAPSSDVPRIDPPKADPAIVAKVLSGLAPNYGDPYSVYGMKAWAHRLKAKDDANPRSVTPTIRMMYKSALGEVAA